MRLLGLNLTANYLASSTHSSADPSVTLTPSQFEEAVSQIAAQYIWAGKCVYVASLTAEVLNLDDLFYFSWSYQRRLRTCIRVRREHCDRPCSPTETHRESDQSPPYRWSLTMVTRSTRYL